MKIAIPLQADSNNTYPDGDLEIRRGENRPQNVVLVLDDRQIEVKYADLRKALDAIQE